MDLRQRWVIARQDANADWQFFADRDEWTADFRHAVLFNALWSAEEACAHSAHGQGFVRNAADVHDFAHPATPQVHVGVTG